MTIDLSDECRPHEMNVTFQPVIPKLRSSPPLDFPSDRSCSSRWRSLGCRSVCKGRDQFRSPALERRLYFMRQFDKQQQGGEDAPSEIQAEMSGSNTCSALGLTVRGHAPVLKLCRALVQAGHDPARPLRAYRGGVLCLSVRSIGEGAKLTVADDRF